MSYDGYGTVVNLALGTAVSPDLRDQLKSIENLIGSPEPDSFWGNDRANELDGGGGQDLINGAAGNDSLWGRAGSDVLDGSSGDDSADGGAGTDACPNSERTTRCESLLASPDYFPRDASARKAPGGRGKGVERARRTREPTCSLLLIARGILRGSPEDTVANVLRGGCINPRP